MKPSPLKIITLTWIKDTHGLFDYEAKTLIEKKSFEINEDCSLHRAKDDCFISEKDYYEDSSPLIRVDNFQLDYRVSLISTEPNSKMWLVVKYLKDINPHGYKLSEGNWIKLGRVRFRVQKICLQPSKSSYLVIPEYFKDSNSEAVSNHNANLEEEEEEKKNTENIPCRICLGERSTQGDPLLSPCKCSGTMKYIHLNCLMEWLKNKFSSKISEKAMSFYLNDMACELCKFSFPPYIMHENKKIMLFSVNFPSKSYVILDEFKPEKNQRNGIHIISLEDGQNAMVGRGHDCDLKITDISVSRKHCKIRLIGSEFFIEDSKSKFGTLVKMKKNLIIRANYKIALQINRTVIKLVHKVPKNCKSFFCCFGKNKVQNANVLHLTQSEYQDSENDQESFIESIRMVRREDENN